MGDLSCHFDKKEFQCPCCGKVIIKQKLIDKLEAIRNNINIPVIITSGYRCPKYNALIGGYRNSPHLTGDGADCKSSLSPIDFALKAEMFKEIRIGIYPKHTHIDIRPARPSRFWYVAKYGSQAIYSREEKDLNKFIEKVR